MGGDRAAQIKTIDSMERAAERGARLTQQLLAFARQQPLKPERLQPNSVLSGFEAVLRRAIPSSVQLELHLGAGLPEILADGPQLEAALLNLVVNARDAVGPSGAITISTELAAGPPEGSALAAGPYVRVAVRDTGAGMPPEVAARALEPFFTTKPVGKGTGLGLSQVYGLVQQAGGDLRIWSEPGQGTEIALYFPAQDQRAGAAGATDAEKVLVVDDQSDVLGVAVQLFSSLGYEVLSANNGKEALAILRRHPDVAILFSDIVMPDMNGIELARRVRAELPRVKILLASGYAPPQDGGDAPFELVHKPYRLSDIIRKLKALLQEPVSK
jgi:CheY-like chemotaxis protein